MSRIRKKTRLSSRRRIIVLHRAGRYPLGGIGWQTLPYVLGLTRLGHDVTNVEDSGTHPYDPRVKSVVEDSSYSLAFLADMMGRFGLSDRWAYVDGVTSMHHGLSRERLAGLYREADAVFTTERLHQQRERIVQRLERHGHPADVLTFPSRLGSHRAAHRLLGPARRWVAGAAAAGLVAGLVLGFAVDRRVGSISARRTGKAASAAAAASWRQASGEPQDEQILTEIEEVLSGPHRLLEMRALDDMTTPPELQKEASFDPR